MERAEKASTPPDFGTLLRRHRVAAGLSQEALAERARISVNGLSSLERGVRRTPRRDTLALLSAALELNESERQQFESAVSFPVNRGRGPSVAVGPWERPAVTDLPFALTSFVGRDCEVAEITALVRDHRMVTITGAGGVGKTQTALHAAVSVATSEGANAYFVALAPVATPEQVVAAIASSLGVPKLPNQPLLETVIAHIQNNHLLLVLDNCEHFIGEAALVANALLTACARTRILATSREPLRAAGEYAYRLPVLNFPAPEAVPNITAGDATAYGSLLLFRDRANAAEHRFTLTDENASSVAEICRRLDGIRSQSNSPRRGWAKCT